MPETIWFQLRPSGLDAQLLNGYYTCIFSLLIIAWIHYSHPLGIDDRPDIYLKDSIAPFMSNELRK